MKIVPLGLNPAEAKRFYDRFGRLQDLQIVYEGRALRRLERAGRFEEASAVLEFGCGTGAFARRLLERRLPAHARYVGLDVSETMVRIARSRLARWAPRAEVRLISGSMPLPVPERAFDRFVSAYVLDLLPDDAIRAAVTEAERVLRADGLLCLVSLTDGATAAARVLSRLWARLSSWKPQLTGGCRPVELLEFVRPPAWSILERRVITQLGISSELIVARKRPRRDG